MWVQYVFLLVTLGAGISTLAKGTVYPGIAGIAGPGLCRFAGASLKGFPLTGTRLHKLGGLGAAIVCVIVGVTLTYHSGYWIRLFGYYMTGVFWCAVMLAVGFLFTRGRRPGTA